MKPKPDKDLAKWCAALATVSAPIDVVPPGWHTVIQLSNKTKAGVPTLQKKLRHLLNSGQAERKNFRIRLAKNVRPVPHYRLK
jgi:hypothetical protein